MRYFIGADTALAYLVGSIVALAIITGHTAEEHQAYHGRRGTTGSPCQTAGAKGRAQEEQKQP
ncbi:MAG: hypothetical protein R3C44_21000 [Chloroflexota bacterium]